MEDQLALPTQCQWQNLIQVEVFDRGIRYARNRECLDSRTVGAISKSLSPGKRNKIRWINTKKSGPYRTHREALTRRIVTEKSSSQQFRNATAT